MAKSPKRYVLAEAIIIPAGTEVEQPKKRLALRVTTQDYQCSIGKTLETALADGLVCEAS